MKKLNLEKLKLAAEDVLQRNQMGSIYGGSGSGEDCPSGSFPCSCDNKFLGCYTSGQKCVDDCLNP